jgi:hypothetical protein
MVSIEELILKLAQEIREERPKQVKEFPQQCFTQAQVFPPL